jgi:hypothetical protein
LNFFWILAVVQAIWVGIIWYTGRIHLRGWKVIDRNVEPKRFRLFLIVFALSVPLLIAGAAFPSFSGRMTE